MGRRGQVQGGLKYRYLPLGTASGVGAASEFTDFGEPLSPKMKGQIYKSKRLFDKCIRAWAGIMTF